MGTAVIITSGKGGTGKTTAAAAISCSLAALGNTVLCIDADVGLRNLDLSLGMSELAVMNFYDVLDGRCSLKDAAVGHPRIEGLFLLTAPVSVSYEQIDRAAMLSLVNSAKEEYDYVIIDCPAGIGKGFDITAACADRALVVSTADDASCRDAQRAVSELRARGTDNVRLIVNRVKPRLLKRVSSDLDEVIDTVGARLIGFVPEDDTVSVSANLGRPLALYSRSGAAKAFVNIAMRLEGRRIPLTRV